MLFLPPPAPPVSYSREIAPIFAMHCNFCHGDAGGFNTSNYKELMAGGNKGKVILARNADGSLLVHFIDGRRGEKHRMPLGGKPLTSDQIQLIRRWIDEGAREDHAALPRYLRTLRNVSWPAGQTLTVTFGLNTQAYVTLRIRDSANHRILVKRIGPVKRLKEDANLGNIGVPISFTFHQGVGWPSSVDVEVHLEYTTGDPGDIQLKTNSP